MTSMKFLILSTLVVLARTVYGIQWNGNWALGCDWSGNNLSNERSRAEDCGPLCERSSECTHFTWSSFNSGTCWLKKGNVQKSDAIGVNDKSMVCGIRVSPLPVTNKPDLKPNPGKLGWSDEFDSQEKFNQNWKLEIGDHGWGNQERQNYTTKNTRLRNGFLEIISEKTPKGYDSARLVSKRGFKYGVVEVRAKLPRGRGTWPAIWMLSSRKPLKWPRDGEIDIMEHVGYDQDVVHATIHCDAYNHLKGTQKQSSMRVNGVADSYHVYKLDWRPDSIRVYYDNVKMYEFNKEQNADESKWPFNHEFNIILNTAIGGTWGAVNGIDDSLFPHTFSIDYVRYYPMN